MRRLFALLAALAMGCGSAQMSDCLKAWWVGTAQSCVVACMATPPPDACAAQDCRQIPILGFDGERYFTGTIAASAALREFSFVGAVLQGAYAASSGSAVMDGANKQATCSGDRLTVNGVVFKRACDALARSLDATAASSWTGQRSDLCP